MTRVSINTNEEIATSHTPINNLGTLRQRMTRVSIITNEEIASSHTPINNLRNASSTTVAGVTGGVFVRQGWACAAASTVYNSVATQRRRAGEDPKGLIYK